MGLEAKSRLLKTLAMESQMAHCPKCGKGKIKKPKNGEGRSCRHCGPLRQLIFMPSAK